MAKETETNPKGAGRHPSVTWEMFEKVCTTLELTNVANKSCELNGLKYQTVKDTINRMTAAGDTSWQELWDLAKEKYVESLRLEAHRRAVDGWEEPVFGTLPGVGSGSGVVGHKHMWSETLLRDELKAYAPEYKNRSEVAIVDDRAVGGMDIYTKLSLKAQRAIRAIITADLEEQRLATATQVEVISQQALEGPSE